MFGAAVRARKRNLIDNVEAVKNAIVSGVYILGALLFVVGSLLFVPGATVAMDDVAVLMFGIGSICFLVATAAEPAVSAPRNFCKRFKKEIKHTVTARTSDIYLVTGRDIETEVLKDLEHIHDGGVSV